MDDTPAALVFAVVFAMIACGISFYEIYMHYRYPPYSPKEQKYIHRIVFMVPVYALLSLFAFIFTDAGVYLEAIRDWYEAWILYNFMHLCIEYLGGEGEMHDRLNGTMLKTSWVSMTCCLPPTEVGPNFLKVIKGLVVQFVIVKGVLGATTIVLYSLDSYDIGNWSTRNGYLYVTILYNVCYCLALYGLVLFYLASHDALKHHKPLVKFVLIKAVIFLTYWQGLLLSVLQVVGLFETAENAIRFQNFLLCFEMVPAAMFMWKAFPWETHRQIVEEHFNSVRVSNNFSSTLYANLFNVSDVGNDIKQLVHPSYQAYTQLGEGERQRPVGHVTFNVSDAYQAKLLPTGMLDSSQPDFVAPSPASRTGSSSEQLPGAGPGTDSPLSPYRPPTATELMEMQKLQEAARQSIQRHQQRMEEAPATMLPPAYAEQQPVAPKTPRTASPEGSHTGSESDDRSGTAGGPPPAADTSRGSNGAVPWQDVNLGN